MEASVRRFDFVSNKYAQIGEPLNLRGRSRAWFASIFERQRLPARSVGLVLGATPWIGEMLRSALDHATLIDINPAMLETARAELSSYGNEAKGTLELVEANWLEMPLLRAPIAVAVGDNSFSFVRYPEGWRKLCAELADRMHPGAPLVARFLTIPARRPTIDEILKRWLGATEINYTAVRTAMLFARADEETYELHPARAVAMFDEHRAEFARLFETCPCTPDNDLLAIERWRGSQAVFYAPPLAQILDTLGGRFRVTDVHFGPFDMAECFPLIVATCAPR
ncbi:MAG: class I SAM-dependent methyltransferase [Polyangiaceae bacterium]|nr:class I SAM-dependent methyltransferase [Polyangiaceae bacterium]